MEAIGSKVSVAGRIRRTVAQKFKLLCPLQSRLQTEWKHSPWTSGIGTRWLFADMEFLKNTDIFLQHVLLANPCIANITTTILRKEETSILCVCLCLESNTCRLHQRTTCRRAQRTNYLFTSPMKCYSFRVRVYIFTSKEWLAKADCFCGKEPKDAHGDIPCVSLSVLSSFKLNHCTRISSYHHQ